MQQYSTSAAGMGCTVLFESIKKARYETSLWKTRRQKQLFALTRRSGKSQKEKKQRLAIVIVVGGNITRLFSIRPRLAGENHISTIGERLVRRWSNHARRYELVAAISTMLCDVRCGKLARYFT